MPARNRWRAPATCSGFRHVDARYGGSGRSLHDVSFVARPGTVTAIVGPLRRQGRPGQTDPRFYRPAAGEVLLDGLPLAGLPARRPAPAGRHGRPAGDAVRRQRRRAMSPTVNWSAPIPRASGRGPRCQCHGFVERLPGQLERTSVPKGGKLSAPAAALAIARAHAQDARSWSSTEATAALDNASNGWCRTRWRSDPDRTTLVIAHRLSTIRHADQVLVLGPAAGGTGHARGLAGARRGVRLTCMRCNSGTRHEPGAPARRGRRPGGTTSQPPGMRAWSRACMPQSSPCGASAYRRGWRKRVRGRAGARGRQPRRRWRRQDAPGDRLGRAPA